MHVGMVQQGIRNEQERLERQYSGVGMVAAASSAAALVGCFTQRRTSTEATDTGFFRQWASAEGKGY